MHVWGKHGKQQENSIGKFETLKKLPKHPREIIFNKVKYQYRNICGPFIRKPRMILILFHFAVENWHKYLLKFQKPHQSRGCNKPEVIAWLTPVFKTQSEAGLSIRNITSQVCSSGNFKCPGIYIIFTLLQCSVFHMLLRLPCGCRANWINSQFPGRLVS